MIVLDLDKNKPAMVLNLAKEVPQLKKLRGTLGWDPHPLYGDSVSKGYDLDIFLLGVNAAKKITSVDNVVYFNNKYHASGALSVPVDNQNGVNELDVNGNEIEDDEYFLADLDNIPADLAEVHVYVFIHQAAERGQNFGMVKDTRFDMINEETGETLVRYQVTQQFSNETCLHVANLVRADGGWEVHPMGTGGTFDPNQVLQAYL